MISLEADGIALSIEPGRGGKITSLVGVGNVVCREWLEGAEGPLVGSADPRVAFDVGDMCGWDEMMPSIAPCRYPGSEIELPDHGELWRKAWDVTAQGANWVSTRVAGDALAYVFERTLTLEANSLRVDYRVSTDVDDDLYFLWAAHPLFDSRPGTRVVLGHRPMSLVRYGDPTSGPIDTWPADGVSVEGDLGVGASEKLFLAPGSEDVVVSLVDSDGPSLTMRWRRVDVPYVGLWLDNRAYSRHPVVAIEPTNWTDDALDSAVTAGGQWVVAKGRDRVWSIEVVVATKCDDTRDEVAATMKWSDVR
jgi:hypothetical protein